ncbi:DNA-binding protein [Methylobacterium sp. J-078]|uniref:DNA-binding protein n=1 Tax=Methylobacterium sp. J-078 TaxID=2836657 RepID=UPI001FBB4AE9|nr:DNA-binding protein [Methylobacterium sp. J-078]MCJ2046814.1 DNA-binding protein [Methylobacterium sp. J-078]
MVDRAEVFRVADKLRALRGDKKVRVSVRRVRDALERKGSFSDVGPELLRWKAARNYQPVIELMELPDALQRRLGDFGKALLDEVQAHESRIRDGERRNFEVEREAYGYMLDEAGMTVDVLEARVAALTAEVERLRRDGATEADAGRTPEEVAEEHRRRNVWERGASLRALMARKMDEKVVPGAQEAFWQDVEREVLALLRKRGPMPAGDLLTNLSGNLLNRGADVEMPLSVGWLRFRLRALAVEGGSLVEKGGRFVPAEKGIEVMPEAVAPWLVDEAPPTTDGDAVMRDVRDVLARHGPMRPSEIVPLLPAGTTALARQFWSDGLDRFAKKMSERVGPKTYFHPLGDGRYAAGPEPEGEQVKRLRR